MDGICRELSAVLKTCKKIPLLLKTDFCCPMESLSEGIQAQIRLQRQLVDDRYQDCLSVPLNCTSFRFTDSQGDLIPAGLLESLGRLRVVYATAIVAVNASTAPSAINTAAPDTKSLLLFAEVGGITVIPEIGKVKLVTLRTKPNQVLSPGSHQDLQITLPPQEQFFDLKSPKAQQLLVQEQSLVHIEDQLDLHLVPIHVNKEDAWNFSANSVSCLPITFELGDCELVTAVNDTVICQKLCKKRTVIREEEALPPQILKLYASVFGLGMAATIDKLDLIRRGRSGPSVQIDKTFSNPSSPKLAARKRGRPKKTTCTASENRKSVKIADSVENEKSEIGEDSHTLSVVKPSTRRQTRSDVASGKITRSRSGPKCEQNVKVNCKGRRKSTPTTRVGTRLSVSDDAYNDAMKENHLDFIGKACHSTKIETADVASRLLVLADAASISFTQFDELQEGDMLKAEARSGVRGRRTLESRSTLEENNSLGPSTRRSRRGKHANKLDNQQGRITSSGSSS